MNHFERLSVSYVMEKSKQIAAAILSNLGYRVEIIPESTDSSKRADVFAECECDRYVIEVKQRFEDSSTLAANNDRLTHGEFVETSETHSRSNRMDAIMRGGLKQINETPKVPGTFNLLWLYAEGVDADLKAIRALNTFYGLVNLAPRSLLSPSAKETRCFYFDHNTSIRLPTVHALVIVNSSGLQLCINEFADSASQFRKSSLVKKLDGGVVDPAQCELTGEAIVLRTKVPRSDDATILREIYELTSNHYFAIRLQRHAVSAAVNPNRAT